ELADLESGIDFLKRAVELAPDDHPSKIAAFSNLGISYDSRFERLGELNDLNLAIYYTSQAVSLAPQNDPNRLVYLNNLSMSYLAQFECLGNVSDLEQAITCLNQVVTFTPDDDPDKARWLSNLGISHWHLFKQTGELAGLEKAIESGKRAMELAAEGHPDAWMWLNNLGTSYLSRFERLGQLADLDEAISCSSQAILLSSDDHPERPKWLGNLGMSYQTRFERLGEIADLDMAVEYLGQAESLFLKENPAKPGSLSNLGSAYQSRYKRLGNLADLNLAIDCLNQAMLLTPELHLDRTVRLHNLGISYLCRFDSLKGIPDLEAAINCFSEAFEISPEEYPNKPAILTGLGMSYQRRFDDLGELEDLNLAIEHKEQGLSLTPEDDPNKATLLSSLGVSYESRFDRSGDREILLRSVTCAKQAAQLSTGRPLTKLNAALAWARISVLHQVSRPLEAYQHLTGLIPEVVWLGSSAALRYELVARISDLATSAANIAITHQKFDLALEWLEEGRSVVWNQLLQLRSPLDELSEVDPALAETLKQVAQELEAAHPPSTLPLRLSVDQTTVEQAAQSRHRLAEQREALVKQARLLPGMPDFLRAKRASSLLEAARTGVPSQYWTSWDIRLPHITWCTTGPLSFLPLHAAGDYSSPDSSLFDHAISSFTPNLGVLIASRESSVAYSGILAISQAHTPGQGPLPGTIAELDVISRQAIDTPFTRLDGEQATTSSVLAALDDHSWVHFACHASQNTAKPTASAFHLHDGPLDIATITQKQLKHSDLAFLSACQTATGDENLSEEAVHLAAGMLMTGFRTVIATMWSIDDADAPLVADKFYAYMLDKGIPRENKAARALHYAVRCLRNKIGEKEFGRWAPYIHLGI
ncbi:hypothetical protein FRC06_002151, partial [Ceratobasidium sp. 370]